MAVYLLRYHQNKKDDIQYRRIIKALDANAYLHEVSRGEVLLMPICQIYFIRKLLFDLTSKTDTVVLTPLPISPYVDPAARSFVNFWLSAEESYAPPTVEDLVAQFDR